MGEVESLYMEALKIQEKLLGENHFGVATTLNNYGQLLQRQVRSSPDITSSNSTEKTMLLPLQSRLEEAEPVMRRALQIDEAALGKDHALYAIDLNNLASLLQKMVWEIPSCNRMVKLVESQLTNRESWKKPSR